MSSNQNQQTEQRGFEALKQHCLQNKINTALWASRMLTIFFGFVYLIFGSSSSTAYSKVLIANAATSALRLHQRLPRVQLTLEFFRELITEDSCHYLFYSFVFLTVTPSMLPLLPVILFAILHTASYSLTLLDLLGQNSWWGARLLISLVELQSRNILRLISFTEIILMPYLVMLMFMGRANLLTPIMYYHVLTQRYISRRNPHTRNMFRELRMSVEKFGDKPSMPMLVKKLLAQGVQFVSWLGPQQIPASQ